jgi:uncharacterized membrane protein YcaP (DUF421 family)
MEEQKTIEIFDWHRIFFSDDFPLNYLSEIAFRTLVMFMMLIIGLKFLSKRGVKQLSVFELAILIALGSAIGDPMFYNHVPVTFGIVVLIVVIFLYRVITKLTGKFKLMEVLLEGKPVLLLKDGRIQYDRYKKIGLPYDKFFAELRLKSVDHLGQVSKAYLETSGEISIYLFEDDKVIEGLPIFPDVLEDVLIQIEKPAHYACISCGNVQHIRTSKSKCSVCENDKWIEADKRTRVQ